MLKTTETLLAGLAASDETRWARFYRAYAPWIENTLLKRDYPTDSSGHSLLLPAYHIEPGSRVIFTENANAPKDLIESFSL